MIGKNNIFNIRYQPSNNWIGQTGFSADSKGNKWCNFSSDLYAIRTCFYLLYEVYMKRRGYRSLDHIISCFAPPIENNTSLYVNFILSFIKTHTKELHPPYVDMVYHKHFFPLVLSAMAKMETGTNLSPSYIADVLSSFGYGSAISYQDYWYKDNNHHV